MNATNTLKSELILCCLRVYLPSIGSKSGTKSYIIYVIFMQLLEIDGLTCTFVFYIEPH
jgi:hypothetical protein